MIDFNTYKQLHSDSYNFRSTYSNSEYPSLEEVGGVTMDSDDPPPGYEIFVFPGTIVGYNLRQKKWSKYWFI